MEWSKENWVIPFWELIYSVQPLYAFDGFDLFCKKKVVLTSFHIGAKKYFQNLIFI